MMRSAPSISTTGPARPSINAEIGEEVVVASGLQLLEPLVAARLLEEIDCGGHVQSRAVPVQVASVGSRADLRAFIELPYRLHANGTPVGPPAAPGAAGSS